MRKDYLWFLTITVIICITVACTPQAATPTPTLTVEPPAATSTPVLPTATPTVVFYTIQAGDTLSTIAARFNVPTEELQRANNIADPNLIQVGQKLIIPGPTPIPTAAILPTAEPPTPTPNIPPQLDIVEVTSRGAPTAETVVIVNRGRPVSLEGWSLRDMQGNAFIFPNIYLSTGTELRVHTGKGENTSQHLYWGREAAVWEETGDTAILADERGVVYASKPLE